MGEVIFRDAFGNLITNINADHLGEAPPGSWEIEIAGERIVGVLRTYGERPTGSLIALVGSSGWVEVAVVNGDAARQLTAGAGTTVWFRRLLTCCFETRPHCPSAPGLWSERHTGIDSLAVKRS